MRWRITGRLTPNEVAQLSLASTLGDVYYSVANGDGVRQNHRVERLMTPASGLTPEQEFFFVTGRAEKT
jgi:hypothetical protein